MFTVTIAESSQVVTIDWLQLQYYNIMETRNFSTVSKSWMVEY